MHYVEQSFTLDKGVALDKMLQHLWAMGLYTRIDGDTLTLCGQKTAMDNARPCLCGDPPKELAKAPEA